MANKPERSLSKLLKLSPIVTDGILGKRTLPDSPGTIADGTLPGSSRRLSDMKTGEEAFIERLCGNAVGRLRLMEMGLTPGAQVKVLHQAAFGGPMQLIVRGYNLSVRRTEADSILMKSL